MSGSNLFELHERRGGAGVADNEASILVDEKIQDSEIPGLQEARRTAMSLSGSAEVIRQIISEDNPDIDSVSKQLDCIESRLRELRMQLMQYFRKNVSG